MNVMEWGIRAKLYVWLECMAWLVTELRRIEVRNERMFQRMPLVLS